MSGDFVASSEQQPPMVKRMLCPAAGCGKYTERLGPHIAHENRKRNVAINGGNHKDCKATKGIVTWLPASIKCDQCCDTWFVDKHELKMHKQLMRNKTLSSAAPKNLTSAPAAITAKGAVNSVSVPVPPPPVFPTLATATSSIKTLSSNTRLIDTNDKNNTNDNNTNDFNNGPAVNNTTTHNSTHDPVVNLKDPYEAGGGLRKESGGKRSFKMTLPPPKMQSLAFSEVDFSAPRHQTSTLARSTAVQTSSTTLTDSTLNDDIVEVVPVQKKLRAMSEKYTKKTQQHILSLPPIDSLPLSNGSSLPNKNNAAKFDQDQEPPAPPQLRLVRAAPYSVPPLSHTANATTVRRNSFASWAYLSRMGRATDGSLTVLAAFRSIPAFLSGVKQLEQCCTALSLLGIETVDHLRRLAPTLFAQTFSPAFFGNNILFVNGLVALRGDTNESDTAGSND